MRISDFLADAKSLVEIENSSLLLINNHIMFNVDVVEDVRPPSHMEMTNVAEDACVPIDQQELLAIIRDTSLGLHPRRNPDDDDITEFASGTDDDTVRDASKFLNTSEDIVDEDEQEDEIGWDPRAIPYSVTEPPRNSSHFGQADAQSESSISQITNTLSACDTINF
ncbi:hypothetical protein BDZ97DRAFT_103612 [Flammula alnicola]|nr:hypothetical protein BDZ97DRAFT_103612 [Flammula alnicola]